MRYKDICRARFIDRPNRFIAYVELNGKKETVNVKNTGRCRELLRPEAEVILCYSGNPSRKTAYDLIAVEKPGIGMVNIDSQAPNQVVKEWLQEQAFDLVRPEYRYGDSRIDFYMEKEHRRYLMEVKGCTLEMDGIGYFPDAPTERGVKHLRELTKAVSEGYWTYLAFVIQMEGITKVLPDIEMHPEFGMALKEAEEAGVNILYLPCKVTEDTICIMDDLKKNF